MIKRPLYKADNIVGFIVETMGGNQIVVTDDNTIDFKGLIRDDNAEVFVVEKDTFLLMENHWNEDNKG